MHRKTPFRLLLSVPSIKTFLAAWTISEPSEIDFHILSVGRIRKSGLDLEAILGVSADDSLALIKLQKGYQYPLHSPQIVDRVEDMIRLEDNIVGGGPAAALKSMQVKEWQWETLTEVAFAA